jgi:hypothetical protein
MQSRDFAYWLQGYFEIVGASSNREPDGLTSGQVEMIKKHLAMVFVHEIDPAMGNKDHQAKLNELHGAVGGKPTGPILYRC